MAKTAEMIDAAKKAYLAFFDDSEPLALIYVTREIR
jgi:hypothetical protein